MNIHQRDSILWYESELIYRFFFNYFNTENTNGNLKTDNSAILADTSPINDSLANIRRFEAVGNFRRRCETLNRLDFLVVCDSPELFFQQIRQCPAIAKITSQSSHRLEAKLVNSFPSRTGFHSFLNGALSFHPNTLEVPPCFGIGVSFQIVSESKLGTAFWQYTGSAAHLEKMESRFGETIFLNEFETEYDLCCALGIPWIPPELREGHNEIDWAIANTTVKLVELRDLKGDLHSHTTWTDGRNTAKEMLFEAQRRGWEYFAITDHSQRALQCNGLSEQRLLFQWKQLETLQKEIDEYFQQHRDEFPHRTAAIRVLKGIEVDILESGRLDLSDEVLAQADWVVASLHFDHDQPRALLTRRLLSAIENPHVCVIAHPTGRYLPYGVPYDVDFEAVFAAAAQHGCFLELNSHPRRLDLNDVHCSRAKELGVKIVISSDAHSCTALSLPRFGVNQARRAALTPDDVANTRSWNELKELSKKRIK